ncbi:ACP phosphodiesterase [Kiritimatiellaeota bacterium B1221]|nr:ACP phosphodiesterase [Kiritimatiellaeota bacterium B1221]
MNTLCHLCLALDDPEIMLGQFLGDFARGEIDALPYPETVRRGIKAHRRVDAAGENHPALKSVKRLLPEKEKRFGGVLFDLYGDYLLHRNWDQLMDRSWSETVILIERFFASPPLPLPAEAARYAGYLLEYRILQAYEQAEQLPDIFDRVGRRFRKPVPLAAMLKQLRRHEDLFLTEFPDYFKDMKAASDEICFPE